MTKDMQIKALRAKVKMQAAQIRALEAALAKAGVLRVTIREQTRPKRELEICPTRP